MFSLPAFKDKLKYHTTTDRLYKWYALLLYEKGNNAELLKWWSQYMESRGEFAKARQYYGRAEDFLSLVRLACQNGNVNRVRSGMLFGWLCLLEVGRKCYRVPESYHVPVYSEPFL